MTAELADKGDLALMDTVRVKGTQGNELKNKETHRLCKNHSLDFRTSARSCCCLR